MKRLLPFLAVLVAVTVATTTFAIAFRLGLLPSRGRCEEELEPKEVLS
jgi:hypothetical protein